MPRESAHQGRALPVGLAQITVDGDRGVSPWAGVDLDIVLVFGPRGGAQTEADNSDK